MNPAGASFDGGAGARPQESRPARAQIIFLDVVKTYYPTGSHLRHNAVTCDGHHFSISIPMHNSPRQARWTGCADWIAGVWDSKWRFHMNELAMTWKPVRSLRPGAAIWPGAVGMPRIPTAIMAGASAAAHRISSDAVFQTDPRWRHLPLAREVNSTIQENKS